MGGPSLDDAAAIECPPHKPFKCLKYGICYGHDEYCDQSSNDVHSCFPLHLQDEGDRLGWCHRFLRGEVSALHPSCQFACNYRFNSTFGNYISPEESIVTGPNLQDLADTVCESSKPHKCIPYGQCYGFDSYCDQEERSVVSCFPDKVKDDTVARLNWCRNAQPKNDYFALHPQCQAACFVEFGCSQESSNTWMIAFLVCVACLVLSLILNIVLLLKRKCSNKQWYKRMNTEDDSQMANMEYNESPVDESKAPNLPPVDLKRQRSLNEEEKTLGDTTSMQSGTPANSLGNASASTDDGFATGENSDNQQPSIGVTVRDSADQAEEERLQGHNDQYQHTQGDDERSLRGRDSFGGSQSSSSSTRSMNGATGEQRGGSSGSYASQTSLAEVEAEKRRQRAHHAPETIEESRDHKTPIVTNLQAYINRD